MSQDLKPTQLAKKLVSEMFAISTNKDTVFSREDIRAFVQKHWNLDEKFNKNHLSSALHTLSKQGEIKNPERDKYTSRTIDKASDISYETRKILNKTIEELYELAEKIPPTDSNDDKEAELLKRVIRLLVDTKYNHIARRL